MILADVSSKYEYDRHARWNLSRSVKANAWHDLAKYGAEVVKNWENRSTSFLKPTILRAVFRAL